MPTHLLCTYCLRPLTSTKGQRRGSHARCAIENRPTSTRASWRRQYGYYRVMVRRSSGRLHQVCDGSVAYLLRVVGLVRHRPRSIVGRCWIEKSTEPAVIR